MIIAAFFAFLGVVRHERVLLDAVSRRNTPLIVHFGSRLLKYLHSNFSAYFSEIVGRAISEGGQTEAAKSSPVNFKSIILLHHRKNPSLNAQFVFLFLTTALYLKSASEI